MLLCSLDNTKHTNKCTAISLTWRAEDLTIKVSLSASVWTRLVIFVPGQGLGGEDEPVLLGSSLHDADVVDGQPALPDHLKKHTDDNGKWLWITSSG